MLVANGQRLFVLGLYENPSDDAVLQEVAKAGFNLVHASADPKTLDRLNAAGLYGWINVGGCIDFSDNRAAGEKQLRELSETAGKHPALLVWEVPDEALWNCWLGAWNGYNTFAEQLPAFRRNVDKTSQGMVAGYQFLHELDPHHPVWMNHASGNASGDLIAFNRGADLVGLDMYPVLPYPMPVWDFSRKILGMVGTSTQRMQYVAPGKPIWMVLQGCGWVDFDGLFGNKNPDGQRPTYEESRFMAFDVVVRGARAFLYWGTHFSDKNGDCWHGITKTVRELADMQHVLSARDAAVQPKVSSGVAFGLLGGGVRALVKDVNGTPWILVVNEFWFPMQYRLAGLDAYDGQIFADKAAGVNATVKNGTLSTEIPGYGVQILK
jgi:hypothetical protein